MRLTLLCFVSVGRLINEVVVPLLSMQQSCLLCISTLLESGNHYSKMFELRDPTTGEHMFEQISITLVCGAANPTWRRTRR